MLKFCRAALLLILFFSTTCIALPFSIVPAPGTTLPTAVQTGQSVQALYLVTNLARETLTRNYVKYLPPNVSQVTFDPTVPGVCGPTFDLTANGTPGDSCTLELSVSGDVDPNDPNPHHHLFACLFGGILCAGTNFPLSVTSSTAPPTLVTLAVTPTNATILFGQTQQYTATGTFSDGSTQNLTTTVTWASTIPGVAAVNSSGLVTTIAAGTTTISATVNGISGSTTLTVSSLSMVGGDYLTNSNTLYPIVVQSTNNGTTWNYTVNSTTTAAYPTDFTVGNGTGFNVVASTCAGLHCVNVGSYTTNTPNTGIYGFQTTNGGSSWTFFLSSLGPLLPTGYTTGQMAATTCLESTCIAAGGYVSTVDGNSHPFVAQTLNSGTTWTTAVDSTTALTNAGTSAALDTSTCTNSICIAGGTYTDGNGNAAPLLAQTTNGGATWSFGIDDTTTIPAGSSGFNAIINGTACTATSSVCIASGSYVPGVFENQPWIFETTNIGGTWTSVINGTTIMPGDLTSGVLTSAACAIANCIGVGWYGASDSNDYPLVYTRNSSGAYSITLDNGTGPALPTDYPGISLSFVSSSCSGNTCVIAGSYQANNGLFEPLVGVSQDGGNTWAYKVTSTTPTQPSDFNGITMGGTTCSGLYCVIAAQYTNTSNISQPCVLQSTDGGQTWAYVVTSTSPTVPADTAQIFLAASGISSQNLTDKLKDKTKKSFRRDNEVKHLLYNPTVRD